MNLLLLHPSELLPSELPWPERAVIVGERARSVQSAHNLRVGIVISIGVFGGDLGEGTVEVVCDDRIEVSLAGHRPPPVKVPAIAIVGISRPQTIKKVIQIATTMGIQELHFLRSEQGEKSYLHSHALQRSAIEEEVWKGLEQAKDTVPPIVEVHERFRPFVEDTLPRLPLLQGAGVLRVVGDTRAAAGVGEILRSASPVTAAGIAIGPENGWSDFEIGLFRGAGYLPVTLGPRMMRVESALAIFLGQFDLLRHLPHTQG